MVVIVAAVAAILSLSSFVCLFLSSTDYDAWGKKECVTMSSFTQYTCTESLLYAKALL